MKIDIDTLRRYEKENWIYSQTHPILPLIIWNYSQMTQYEQKWDEITLNCRGLITDLEGSVVSKGFPKFFNYSEGRTNIPEKVDHITVYEKVDGSYIGLFCYEGEWIVNSKGSFTSEQVVWAKEILDTKDINGLNDEYTYCFELVHPTNRIVCNYGDRKDLIYLSAFENEYGTEVSLLERPKNFTLPMIETGLIWDPVKLKNLNYDNEEGFVVRFDNGERCKIKFDEYVRLHAIVTNTTSYDIWRCLKEGDDFNEILNRVPDEFYKFVKKTKYDILRTFYKIKSQIYQDYSDFLYPMSDKEFAMRVKANSSFIPQCFALRNNKDIDKWIWEQCKPEFKKAFQL